VQRRGFQPYADHRSLSLSFGVASYRPGPSLATGGAAAEVEDLLGRALADLDRPRHERVASLAIGTMTEPAVLAIRPAHAEAARAERAYAEPAHAELVYSGAVQVATLDRSGPDRAASLTVAGRR